MYGTGAKDDPYIVTTAQELYDIRAGGNTPGDATTHYRQGNNICIPSALAEIWCLGTDADKTYHFSSYRGNGYKVTGLNFDYPSVDNVGLFPLLPPTTQKTISDLGVECNLVGGTNVGGLCGNNTTSSGSSSISNCYATGAVSGSSNVGGLCGSNTSSGGSSSISNCYATGAVSGSSNVGGLCGRNTSSSGGSSSISNCYATGAVSGTSNVGGICGSNTSSSSYGGSSSISNCYATGAVSGTSNVGGLCGYNRGYSSAYLNARIIGCFALNPKIIRDKYAPANDTFGRIFGASSSHTLDRNYALETMLFYPNGDE